MTGQNRTAWQRKKPWRHERARALRTCSPPTVWLSLARLLLCRARLRFTRQFHRSSPFLVSPGATPMNDRLQSALHQLRLSGLAQTLDVRLQEAAGHQLSHAEFLELILQDELLVRAAAADRAPREGGRLPRAEAARRLRLVASTRRSSGSRSSTWPPAASSAKPRDVLLLGPPGTGKIVPGPGHRLPGDQAGLRRAVPLDLRRGPRLPARRGARQARTRCWPAISSPTC